MQLFHELVLLLETIGERLVLPELLICHVEEFFSPKPYLAYQFEIKIEDLR